MQFLTTIINTPTTAEEVRMTAAYDDGNEIKAPENAPHGQGLVTWLADQWPKVAVLSGVVLTFAWITVLVWMAIFVLDLL